MKYISILGFPRVQSEPNLDVVREYSDKFQFVQFPETTILNC